MIELRMPGKAYELVMSLDLPTEGTGAQMAASLRLGRIKELGRNRRSVFVTMTGDELLEFEQWLDERDREWEVSYDEEPDWTVKQPLVDLILRVRDVIDEAGIRGEVAAGLVVGSNMPVSGFRETIGGVPFR